MDYRFRFIIFFVFGFLMMFAPTPSNAQLRYGNEWIDFHQKYYKIRLCKDGIYKITYADLKNAGIKADSIHPGRYQLFFRGVEQYIFITGAADGKFDPTDEILFFGQKNDGTLDAPLYSKPANQHHSLFSLYTDSSFYFLTWKINPVDTLNRRMQFFNQTDFSNYKAEDYIPFEKYYTFNEQYFDGTPIVVKSDINLSMLTYGEGWLSYGILNGQSRSVNIDVPSITFNGMPLTAEFLAFGKSEVQNFTGDDHHLQITAGSIPLFDTLYKGFGIINRTFSISNNQVDTFAGKINFTFTSPQVSGVAASQTALSLIRLNYSMKPDLGNNSYFAFSFTPQTSGIRYFRFNNYPLGKKQAVLFDLTNHRMVRCSKSADSLKILLPLSPAKQMLYISDTADYMKVEINGIQFSQFTSTTLNKSFLIVTHPTLSKSAKKYAEYRNTKGYSTLLAETQELYDQFYYGYHHPLAVRHFIDYVWQNSATKPSYLLLLGKGLENDLVRDPTKTYPDPADLVPAIGFPCTDNYFSSGIDLNLPQMSDLKITPALATGRIAATSDSMVYAYLSKLKEYESGSNDIWKKNILHIAGEQPGIHDSLLVSKSIASSLPFGGNVSEIFNNKNEPVVYAFRTDIQKKINDGLSLLTYFAHGSLNVLGIDMGQASELKNKGKYPIMFMNGCNVGNAFSNYSLGEQYLFAPDQGAIGWLAHNTSTFVPNLGTQINGFYSELFGKSYSLSFATAIKNLIAKVDPSVLPDREFYQQWIFQGDPALKIYNPVQADYYPDPSSVLFDPQMILATTDSFNLKINIYNKGKAVDTVFTIKIERTLPDQSVRTYIFKKLKTPFFASSFSFRLESGGRKAQGMNKFKITVNYDSAITESDFSNNSVTTDYFLSGSGVNLLMPPEFSIVSSDSVNLIFQNRNILDKESKSYVVQIDTSPKFNSPALHQLPKIKTIESLVSIKTSIAGKDSTVYYWRAKVIDADTTKEVWENSSFIYIKNSPPGWSQSHFPQFTKDEFISIIPDSIHRKFNFSDFSRQITVTASRWTHINRGIKLDYTLSLNPGVCSDHNLVIIRFKSTTLDPAEINRRCNGDADVNYRSFNMFLSHHQDSLAAYINSIPDGDYVAVFTRYAVNFPNWQNNVYTAFDKIGATPLLRNIKNDFSSYVLIGRKQNTTGLTIAEDTIYEPVPPADPADSRTVEINGGIKGMWYSGTLVSTIIGPAKNWNKLHFNIAGADKSGTDSFDLSIIGIAKNGKDTVLKSKILPQDTDISYIDAASFPNLKLHLELNDVSNRTPLQLKRWQITYNPVPEGSIINNRDFSYHADSISEGDTFSFSIPFINISSVLMDSVLVKYSFIHQNQEVFAKYKRFWPLSSGKSVVYSQQIPTKGYSGQNKINIMFNPDNDQPEQYLNNNSLTIPFVVSHDVANPLLDVTFDGRHIMNGEIVSAQPVITIASKDENPVLRQNDTATFEIYLKMPDAKPFHRYWFSGNKLTFYPAKDSFTTAVAIFKPGLLADGSYTLKVQSFDKSGNPAGANPYLIDFKVVNYSGINEVSAFPNPFSDKVNFRFTITGYTIPSEIMIRIIGLDGRLVKEINLPGNKRFYVGQNTITNAWDGTDKSGAVVQNGLYFYQIFVRQFAPGISPQRAQLYFLDKGKLILIR
jgi:hypothetical protein